MSSRAMRMINMVRQKQDVKEITQNNDNEVSVQRAIKDLYYENSDIITHHQPEQSLQINENHPTPLTDRSTQDSVRNDEDTQYTQPMGSEHLQSNNDKPKRIHSNLVEYDYETDDDYSADSDNDPIFQLSPTISDVTDFSDYEVESKEKQLTRKRKSKRKEWKANVTKIRRSECLPYKNKNKDCSAKAPKQIDCTNCKFKCTTNFTEEDRNQICKTYWGFGNYNRQKDYIIKFVQVDQPKRRTLSETNEKARTVSKTYFLKNSSGRHRVCAQFFQKTLCISNGPINTAIKNASSVGCFSGEDKRGKKTPGNKTSEINISMVEQHITSFPVMESHYVRKSSKKLYLDSNLSISKMYYLYKNNFCKDNNVQPTSEKTYRRIFCNNFNYSFFKPKKDLCATCFKYDQASTTEKINLETQYTFHLIRKNQCNEAKEQDKLRSKNDPSFITCSFDLQSVLQLPYSGVSLFYYSRKICVYNLTFYVGYGEKAQCFTWNELHGKRGSSEIGSILYHFLKSLPSTVSEISLFCDTCGGQNRNQQVAAILLYSVKNINNLKKIELKFLESGHSHMECDSMHSAIESAKKYKCAFTMNDWVDIFKSARSPKQHKNRTKVAYEVNLLKFSDFYDLHDLASNTIKNRNKDEYGDTVSWLNIKCIKFEKEYPTTMFYRYDHTSDYKKVNVAGKGRRRLAIELRPAYHNLLPISEQKKADLVKLADAGYIPEEVVMWYKHLPTKKSLDNDRLPEPNYDEESDQDDE